MKAANKHGTSATNQVAADAQKEVRDRLSNGNRENPPDGKPGGAERGGPGIDKAQKRQPPEAAE